ncbi:MAG: NADH-quinone oxidoreductase subunit J [Ignavibacteriae bacterium]|jgi:NADH-quinone oxidoreductase subunit J|nr:NADH-quinone oxidoreductase subunit J [Ignavibacteriota bacterium]NOG96612.1 NADH-quinone oxidoreductase subunit J [Ignavibacteriota bacterium]
MSLYDIIFYLFALLVLVSAFITVTSKNIVHSAFSLMFTLFGVAGIYVLLGADFLGVVQLLVYVGGILILMIFGVMMTNEITNVDIKTGTTQVVPAIIGVGLFAGALTSMMLRTGWNSQPSENMDTTTYAIGKLLLTEYVLIFELLGMLLLVALIGAASVARKEKE